MFELDPLPAPDEETVDPNKVTFRCWHTETQYTQDGRPVTVAGVAPSDWELMGSENCKASARELFEIASGTDKWHAGVNLLFIQDESPDGRGNQGRARTHEFLNGQEGGKVQHKYGPVIAWTSDCPIQSLNGQTDLTLDSLCKTGEGACKVRMIEPSAAWSGESRILLTE